MQIQINSANNVKVDAALSTQVIAVVESTLSRVGGHITRIEIHLSDENGEKSGQNDKRCLMEARLEGQQPIAVTHEAATLDQAVQGAADRLFRLVESDLGLRQKEGRRAELTLKTKVDPDL